MISKISLELGIYNTQYIKKKLLQNKFVLSPEIFPCYFVTPFSSNMNDRK